MSDPGAGSEPGAAGAPEQPPTGAPEQPPTGATEQPPTGATEQPPTGGGGASGDGGDDSMAHRMRRGALGLVSVMVVYYAFPVGELPSGAGVVFSVIGLLCGVGVLAWLIVRQVRRLVRSDPADGSVRLDSLIFLVVVVVPLFAVGYLGLERADAGQFEELSTKTDALYFTLSTLATVGFGDVHATGQLARGLVTFQIAFDLVFVAALVSLLTNQIRERAASRRAGIGAGSGARPGPGPSEGGG
jgi:voltage-gated potassium channel